MNIGPITEAGARSSSTSTRAPRLRAISFALLLSAAAFVVTGCYDPYYGRGRTYTTVSASYGTPYYGTPYYGYGGYYNPYPYGYGYGYSPYYGRTSVGVAAVRTRGHYTHHPRYRHGTAYTRSGYVRRSGEVRRRGEVRRGDRRGTVRRGTAQRTRVRAEVQPE